MVTSQLPQIGVAIGKLDLLKVLLIKPLMSWGIYGSNKMPYKRQLEIKRNMLEVEQVVLREALLANTELDSLRLNDAIIEVKREILVLKVEGKII